MWSDFQSDALHFVTPTSPSEHTNVAPGESLPPSKKKEEKKGGIRVTLWPTQGRIAEYLGGGGEVCQGLKQIQTAFLWRRINHSLIYLSLLFAVLRFCEVQTQFTFKKDEEPQ